MSRFDPHDKGIEMNNQEPAQPFNLADNVGKYVLRRDGQIVGPVELNPDSDTKEAYPFFIEGLKYRSNGRFYYGDEIDNLDIIAPAPSQEPKSPGPDRGCEPFRIEPQPEKGGDEISQPSNQSTIQSDVVASTAKTDGELTNPALPDPATEGVSEQDQNQDTSLDWLTPLERQAAAFRLWSRVTMEPSGCWVWPGSTRTSGYGNIRLRDRLISTHRLSYLLSAGSIPAGLIICHSCDNRLCCNPVHLFAGTYSDNLNDCISKGRFRLSSVMGKRGEKNKASKLTYAKAVDIRSLKGTMSFKKIGKLFGVGPTCIADVMKGKRWKQS
jgi:hypothetical protein